MNCTFHDPQDWVYCVMAWLYVILWKCIYFFKSLLLCSWAYIKIRRIEYIVMMKCTNLQHIGCNIVLKGYNAAFLGYCWFECQCTVSVTQVAGLYGPWACCFHVCLLIRYNLLLAKVWVLYLNINPSSPRVDLWQVWLNISSLLGILIKTNLVYCNDDQSRVYQIFHDP